MNIQIPTNILLPVLQSSASVLDRKHNQPILSNLLLEFNNGHLLITATDLELELSSTLDITSSEDGELAIPARKLLDICRALPAESKLKISNPAWSTIFKVEMHQQTPSDPKPDFSHLGLGD